MSGPTNPCLEGNCMVRVPMETRKCELLGIRSFEQEGVRCIPGRRETDEGRREEAKSGRRRRGGGH